MSGIYQVYTIIINFLGFPDEWMSMRAFQPTPVQTIIMSKDRHLQGYVFGCMGHSIGRGPTSVCIPMLCPMHPNT